MIGRQIDRIKQKQALGDLNALRVKFGGALLSRNVFSTQPEGRPDPTSICRFKVFIDPIGRVTPIHEGTFPARDFNGRRSDNPYVLGRLTGETRLLELLNPKRSLCGISLRHLAPLELFLRLELSREEQDAKLAALAGEKLDVTFGNQIRSYTLHPAQRVKDHRTDVEVGNAQGVLDGNLDPFIRAALLARAGGSST